MLIGLLVPLLAVGAAEPSSVLVQVFDESGAPVRDAVVELNPAECWKSAVIHLTSRPAMAQRELQFVPGISVVPSGWFRAEMAEKLSLDPGVAARVLSAWFAPTAVGAVFYELTKLF